MPTVSVRYFTIFGPRQRPDMAFNKFISAALENREIQVLGDGLQERDFTYVADAVAATVAAYEQGEVGGISNVAGGNHATVLDVIQVLGELLGKRPRVEMLPAIPGDARKTGGDTSRARERLGYVPRIGLAEGLARRLRRRKGTTGHEYDGVVSWRRLRRAGTARKPPATTWPSIRPPLLFTSRLEG